MTNPLRTRANTSAPQLHAEGEALRQRRFDLRSYGMYQKVFLCKFSMARGPFHLQSLLMELWSLTADWSYKPTAANVLQCFRRPLNVLRVFATTWDTPGSRQS